MRTRLIAVLMVLSVLGMLLAAKLAAFQADETRVIALNTVYATFNQEGLKSTEGAVDSEHIANVLSAIRDMPQHMALCSGEDVTSAVRASATSFAKPEEPVPSIAAATNETLWVAAYIGSDGSVPAAFRIRAIEVKGKIIRVAYERDESSGRSCDLRAYAIWAPLGQIEPGAYTLELVDGEERVTVSRTWNVTAR